MPKEPDQAVQAEEVRTGAEEAKGGDAGGSSLQKTDTTKSFDERLAAADTPEAITRLTQELATTPAPKETKAQEESEQKADESAEKERAGEGEGEKETDSEEKSGDGDDAEKEKTKEKEAEKEKAKTGEEEEEEDDDKSDPDWSKNSKQFRGRIAADDKVGALATVILKGNGGRVKAGLKPLTLEQAMAQAKSELGLDKAKEGDDAKAKEGGQEKSDLPATPEAVDAKIRELRAEKARVWRDEVDMDKVNAIEDQIDQLREHKLALREKAVTTEKTAEQEYDRRFEESKAAAVDSYPFVSEPDSEAAKRMQEIDAEMERTKDPTFHDPNKPLIIAQMVAKELRIAPRKKGEAQGQKEQKREESAKPATKPVVKSVVASGASRTVTKTTQQSQQLAAIDNIKSVQDLERFGVGGL